MQRRAESDKWVCHPEVPGNLGGQSQWGQWVGRNDRPLGETDKVGAVCTVLSRSLAAEGDELQEEVS